MEKLESCPHALRAGIFDGHVPGFLHFLHYLHRFLMAQKGSITVKTGDLSTRTSCWDLRLSESVRGPETMKEQDMGFP